MLTVIIPTRESERSLVQTLSPLVSGATAGLIAEVIVADAASSDATEEVAEVAGCVFLRGEGPVGARLKAAAALAKTRWLLFLRPGTVLEPGWLDAADAFMCGGGEAAAFRAPDGGMLARLLRRRVHPEQGLLIRKLAYEVAGGHPAGDDAEAALLRKLGRIALLTAAARRAII